MANDIVKRWIRSEVQALAAYEVHESGDLIKLDAMENPHAWPQSVTEAWLTRLRTAAQLNRYPDPQARTLKRTLRAYLQVPNGLELMLGNGSDELIQIICMGMAGADRVLMTPTPTFSIYASIAQVLGFRLVSVPLVAADFSLDVDAMMAAIEAQQPAVLFLASPNNPTANLLDRDAVEAIVRAAPGVVVIDEAYFPFAGETWLREVMTFPNLLVMRTLSKLGLAGLRLGILVGQPDWLAQLNKVRMPYNVNSLSQISAEFVLEHADMLEAQAQLILRDRADLFALLKSQADLKVWPSDTNFVLFKTLARPAPQVFDSLREQGVLVRCLDGSHPLLADCLRVSIGTAQENEKFIEALARC